MPASDTITTVNYSGTSVGTGTTYGGTLPANVSQNESYTASFAVIIIGRLIWSKISALT